MTDMYAGFPEIYAKNDRLFLESGTMSHATPISVAMICIGLMLCYFMVLLQILCFFHLTGHKKMGMFVAMSVTVIGAISVSFFEKISWLFPMTHAIFGVHFDKFYAQPKYKIVWSLLYFLVLNILLFAENVFQVKKCRIGDSG